VIMSELKTYIGACIPADEFINECGAVKVARAFKAKDLKHAEAKLQFLFMEEYPAAQEAAYSFLICEDGPGMPRPALDKWDEKFMYENDWPEDVGYPVPRPREEQKVDYYGLSEAVRISALIRYGTGELTADMLPGASKLALDDSGSFETHIRDAIIKTPAVASMYPERILEAIDWIKEKCPETKKWPEIKAQLASWQNSHNADVKDTTQNVTKASSPDRFSLVVAFLVQGVKPSEASAKNLKDAKFILESRDQAWVSWMETLGEIPGIREFPEDELYELTLDGMKNLLLIRDAAGRQAYITEHFSGHPLLPDFRPESSAQQNVAGEETAQTETSQEGTTDNTTGAPQGPFYYRSADGRKIGRVNKPARLQLMIADGFIEISHEEYQARKKGTWKDEGDDSARQSSGEDELTRELVSKQLAAERGEFVQGISDPDAENWVHGGKEAQPAAQQNIQETQPAASVSDVQKSLSERPESEQENLALWKNVFKTDERFTRAFAVNGGGTSINGTYMTMIATREFGPKGIGWGVDILEERFDDGAPLTLKNGDSLELITDGNGNFLTEKHHVIKIRLWYIRNGQRGQEVAYGCTPYITNSKYGVVSDGEAPKKSLTDATKKALSSLGFCADIFMGLYDNAEYRSRNKAEFDLKNASENAEDAARLRRELDERLTRVADTLSSAVSTNELKKVYDTIAREVDVHRKAADSKGDAEYAKYLGGRLRRLTQIKDQRMAALTGKEEQSA